MSNKAISVYAKALKRQEKEELHTTRTPTREVTGIHDLSSDKSRQHPRDLSSDIARKKSREISTHLPSRDQIQEFSFRLRDTLKVKVQAEVPHEWQDELNEIARELKVKKLELYRYIYGKFLGKLRDKDRS